MQDTGLGVTSALCPEVNFTTFQSTVHVSKNHNVLVSGQSIINNYLNSFSRRTIMSKKLIFLVSLALVLSMTGNGWAGVSKPVPANGAIHEDTWINLGWEGAGASYDVYFGDNPDNVKDGTADTFQGNQTTKFYVAGFPGFAFPDGLIPGTTYYWRIDEIQDDGTIHTGSVWSFTIRAKTAQNPDPPDGTEFVEVDAMLSWTAGLGAKLHTVYIGTSFDEVNNATGGSPLAVKTFSPGPLEPEKVYYWRVDEFDAFETYKGKVWSFTTVGAAGSPNPSNGAVDVSQTMILSWKPADTASAHQTYLGTDAEAVNNATTASPEYKGSKAAGDETLDPGQLDWDTTYYWRVDAVYDADPGNPVKGLVWNFTTANFLVIDDFESYNDIPTGEEGSNLVYETWIDGFANPTINGSTIGYTVPFEPTMETVIIHGGLQSMPYLYDNAVGNSEATKTLTSTRDWTVNGVNTLIIYFRGSSRNAPEQMYVAVDGVVVNHENPNATQIGIWTAWNLDLQLLASQGVNLTNVSTIAIGFGDKSNPPAGGSGTVFFDDIRLSTSPAPVGRFLLFEDDFESVELGTSVEESAGTENVWTNIPPEGWSVDNSGVPGFGDPDNDGVTEWAGWAFADKQFWINTDQQRRAEFELGQGVVAVADCDEWDDAAHPGPIADDPYDTWLSTPAIDISEAQAGTLQLKFDSSWRPEFDDNYHQTANITASFNGSEPIEVLLWESDSASPNFKDDNSTNDTITVNLENPPWATSIVLTFGLFEAGNDWWWAIDNIQVTGFPK